MSKVTVILVTFNSAAYLPGALAAIRAQEDWVHLAVVDNASKDGSADVVRRVWPDALIIANHQNVGFAAAINQILPRIETPYILLLNPDATLLPGALAQLLTTLEAYPTAAAVGPRQWLDQPSGWQWSVVPYPPHWATILAGLFLRAGSGELVVNSRFQIPSLQRAWELNRAIWWGTRPQAVPYLSGACILLRRDAFQSIGGMDDSYFLFFEDTELSKRLHQAGWQLLVDPCAGVQHGWMGSVSDLPDAGQSHLLASGKLFLQRHADPLTRFLWVTRQKRWAEKGSMPSAMSHDQSTMNIRHTHHTIGDTPIRVEIGLEPTFLYAAAIQTYDPVITLPSSLTQRRIYMRVLPSS